MTRKTHSLKKPTLLQTFLIFLGKPFYKLIASILIFSLFLSSLIKQTVPSIRFIRVNKLILIVIPLSFILLGFGLMYQTTHDFLKDLPDVSSLPTFKNYASTKLYDRNGKLLYKFYDNVNRTPVSLSEIPLTVRLATIAKEDKNFYSHIGISFSALGRVFKQWISEGRITGASTITQQLVKNVYLSPERTVERKIKEIILAFKVERAFTKDQILEYYLNRVPYGGTAYGIQEAAQSYFGKNANGLTLSEAAFLASRPQNPSSSFTDKTAANGAKDEVLTKMLAQGFITQDEFVTAQKQDLSFKQDILFSVAPHFVMYAGDLLQKQFGQSVWTAGYSAYTTIDPAIQKTAEDAVAKELKKIAALHVTNAGVLVLSVKTGQVLAMVGSRDYNDIKYDGNVNTTVALRQPGSSIKIVNYAYALEHGYTPASILDDTPVVFPSKGSPAYKPVNYDGRYVGRISLRNAFAQSRNIPAVRVLASYGVDKMVTLGKQMGITTWGESNRFGLSLTLGGGEVTLMDLAHVYLTIANYGKRIPITAFTDIHDQHSDIFPTCINGLCETEQVLSPEVSFQIINILSDNTARTPSFGPHSALVIDDHPEVAVKTGTSNNLRDNLTVGFNEDYLVAVWVGNNDGTPMSRVASGITGASPIWHDIMASLLSGKTSLAWNVPGELVYGKLCGGKNEWFIKGTEPNNKCSSEGRDEVAVLH